MSEKKEPRASIWVCLFKPCCHLGHYAAKGTFKPQGRGLRQPFFNTLYRRVPRCFSRLPRVKSKTAHMSPQLHRWHSEAPPEDRLGFYRDTEYPPRRRRAGCDADGKASG